MIDSAASPALTLDITGMHCAACAGRVERALEALAGPGQAVVSLTLERADVKGVDAAAAVAVIKAAGYSALVRAGSAQERQLQREVLEAARRADERKTFALFVVAALLFLPFLADMMAAILGYGHGALLAPWVQVALAAPVQFLVAWRFIKGGALALLRRAPNMDVLIALGTLSAFGFSLWRVVTGHAQHGHALYFEGAVAIITFVLLGKVIENSARHDATDALTALAREQPQRALVYREGSWAEVAAQDIRRGEIFAVRAGERAAADGLVMQGTSAMDESLVSGESLPQAKAKGAHVIAGALNGMGALTVEAVATGDDSTLARITRLVEQAQTQKAPVQQLADSIARVFVPAILLIALLTGVFWLWRGQEELALVAAVSVLVVACPCALGLATPIALVSGVGAAAKAGIIVKDIGALDLLAQVSTVAFDKTGTLTEGHPRITALAAPGIGAEDALKVALALSMQGEHPLAEAVRAAAADKDITTQAASDLVSIPGAGVTGRVNGVVALLGSADYVRGAGLSLGALEQVIARDPGFAEAQTVSWLAGAGRIIGAIAFQDSVRAHADQALADLQALGLTVIMLTGDRKVAAQSIGASLGIRDVRAELKPADKVRAVSAMAEEGLVVMVGDGINDAPALAAASVGMAMGSSSEAARAAAGLTLRRADLRLVPKAIRIARATRTVVRQNLGLAFVFNAVGIPMAALGLLTPAVAGAAMAASSVSVVLNAARLSRKIF
jgi:P-type Cu+ transporter